jgi:hypothetical protein
MMGGIQRYIEKHIRPGDFLSAVICNDLKEAVILADTENMENLPAYVAFFHDYTPYACWGSEKDFQSWLEKK